MAEQTPSEQKSRDADSEIRPQGKLYTGAEGKTKVIKGEEYEYSKRILLEVLKEREVTYSKEEIERAVISADRSVVSKLPAKASSEQIDSTLRGYYLGITDRIYPSHTIKSKEEVKKERNTTTVVIPSVKRKGRVKGFFKGLGKLFLAASVAAGALFAGSEIRNYVDSQKHTNKTNRQTFDRLEQRIYQLENSLSDSCSTNQNNYSATKTQLESIDTRVSGLEQTTKEADEANTLKISSLEAEARKTKDYAASLLVTIAAIEAKDRETRNSLVNLNTQYKENDHKLKQELARQYKDAMDRAGRIEQEVKELKDNYSGLQEGLDEVTQAVMENEEEIILLQEAKETKPGKK